MATQTLAERVETLRPTGLSPLLNTAELMARYRVSNWTVNAWVKSGCPVQRLPGGNRRFDLTDVEQWMDSRSEEAAEAGAERSSRAVAGRS